MEKTRTIVKNATKKDQQSKELALKNCPNIYAFN
jgi:hypothetical protein